MKRLQRWGDLLHHAVGRPLFWVAFVGLIFGVPFVSGLTRKHPADVPVLGILPPFTLQSDVGGPVTTATVRGRVWVGLFVDPQCPACLARVKDSLAKLQRHTRNLGSAFKLLALCEDPTPSGTWRQELQRSVRDPTLLWFACGADGGRLRTAAADFLQRARGTDPHGISDGSTLLLVDQRSRLRGAYLGESLEKSALLGDIALLVNEELNH